MNKPDGGPAFPVPEMEKSDEYGSLGFSKPVAFSGMSLRDYACIKLRMPESDKEWLNEIIKKSNSDYLSGVAMANKTFGPIDEMIKEREK